MVLTRLAPAGMTGQMLFDSHVTVLLETTVALVNRLTPGLDGGHEVVEPEDERALRAAVREAINGQGYDVTLRGVSGQDARMIAAVVAEARRVIEDIDGGELALAAKRT